VAFFIQHFGAFSSLSALRHFSFSLLLIDLFSLPIITFNPKGAASREEKKRGELTTSSLPFPSLLHICLHRYDSAASSIPFFPFSFSAHQSIG